ELYRRLERLGERLRDGVQAAADAAGATIRAASCGSVWSVYFRDSLPRTYRDISAMAKSKSAGLHLDYQRWLLANGVYIHPHYMVRGYLTGAHGDGDVDGVIAASASFFEGRRS